MNRSIKKTALVTLLALSLVFAASMAQATERPLPMGNTPANLAAGGSATFDGEWLYFSGNDALWRMKADGSELTQLFTQDADQINVLNGWVYYLDLPSTGAYSSVYHVRADGMDQERFCDVSANQICAAGDWLYLHSFDHLILRLPLDGGEPTPLSEARYDLFSIAGGVLYAQMEKEPVIDRYALPSLDPLPSIQTPYTLVFASLDGKLYVHGSYADEYYWLDVSDESATRIKGVSGTPFDNGSFYRCSQDAQLSRGDRFIGVAGAIIVENPYGSRLHKISGYHTKLLSVVEGWVFSTEYLKDEGYYRTSIVNPKTGKRIELPVK